MNMANNIIEGAIPSSIGNLKELQVLNVQNCTLTGSVPEELSKLSNLTYLNIAHNSFKGGLPASLGKLSNLGYLLSSNAGLGGMIPGELGNCKKLRIFDLSSNSFSGPLTDGLAGLVSLESVILVSNTLSGTIPSWISHWKNVGSILMSKNSFIGSIPTFSLQKLRILDLSNNLLSGKLSSEICSAKSLTYLILSDNNITGTMEDTFRHCQNLSELVLSRNRLSGEIPGYIGNLSLVSLELSGNNFHGKLPDQLWKSESLLELYLGNNLLSGEIPEAISKVKTLLRLQLEFNVFVGSIPASIGELRNLTNLSLHGNLLTGKIPEEPDHSCGFGTVYKASLSEGRTIAVKRLNGGHFHGDREFLAEMETIGKVQHENLVPLFGYCVFAEERFLVYEYMENGSLDVWLRNRADAVETLNWPTRFKICLGSARGIAFLHHGFVPHIIHRDIKSSNILLDRYFEPKVSDFGLARIISAYESHVSTVLAGTFGYIPPEYGQSMVATTKGDIYSFGVVMLELVTGRAPTGQADIEGGNLVGWVRVMVAQGREDEVLDSFIPAVSAWRHQMLQVLGIARMCTNDNPAKRPHMVEVVKLLNEIKLES